ncbi:hypothetical protein LDL76_07980 [Salegentibacter mishustinae]|uniref:hypothetical protein n=1 Tax=Salegentibacter mishustinae TaxID=270918 RepID=UPI001CE14FB7|nr:hypothetical protein [Salegentibacter mishustinae]UBZ08636.1 hypothetical protein LDL76_07980 [Salegentibacter mishustinae]|tara:strand:- start:1537 stop:1755 length:219 start_codon:yes stop_codon:yes gene_type:complete
MTLYEFRLLPEQYSKLFNEGDFITHRLEPNARFALYTLEKFFMEVEYNPESNKIVNKVSFVCGKKLDLYSYK